MMEILWMMFLVLLGWFVFGFLAFLLCAKQRGYTGFNEIAKTDFIACVILGPIALIIQIAIVIHDVFIEFMDFLLFMINC